MPAPGRNCPCPCGSGIKYKKCCLPRDEAARAETTPPPPNRIVHHRGRPLMVSGGDLDPGSLLDHAIDYFERKDRGEGPAAQMARFVEPLLEAVGGDPAGVERALTLGMVFWNLALCGGDQRETMLADLARTLAKTEDDAAELRALALNMVERHRRMFPGLHGK